VTVSLNVHLTPELIAEGNAREFKNRVQVMRKEAGFEVSDRIEIFASASSQVMAHLKTFEDYIKCETLAIAVHYGVPGPDVESAKDWDLAGEMVRIGVRRVRGT
jgi:isoleucyl-tRNA synthetase